MKSRVTVSLRPDLLRQAEKAAKRLGARNRSAVVEQALELLVARERERGIESSLDAYYGTRGEAERAEERRLVRAFNRSQRRHDLDDEGR
jgi:metal-responsive CopG/Arc/MetJ family transcriptional regulator